MQARQIKPEFEFFDAGGVNIVKRYQNKKCCPDGPILCNFLFGNIASTQADLADIAKLTRLLPIGSYCGLAGLGGFQLKANTTAILMGGMIHVRTGLEDSIYEDRQRELFSTNQSLVKRIVKIANLFEHPIATPNEMREMIVLNVATLVKNIEKSKKYTYDPVLKVA